MFNFHIGLPGIKPDLLHIVTRLQKLRAFSDVCILPKKVYKETMRGLVNARRSNLLEDIHVRQKAVDLIQSLAKHKAVAISQHAVLGDPGEFMMSPTALKRATKRIEKISELFHDRELTFHIIIIGQMDYLCEVMGNRTSDVIAARSVLSWSELVRTLKVAAPDRHFVIWDFERPSNVALAYILTMLETADSALIEQLRLLLPRTPALLSSSRREPDLIGMSNIVHQLDDQYDIDLDQIEKMVGVTLVRSDAVLGRFHL